MELVEKDELGVVKGWFNDSEFAGEFEPVTQETLGDFERQYVEWSEKELGQWYFIQKKDRTKIGMISHREVGGYVSIGYSVLPAERRKGHATEAVQLLVNYLFLNKNIVRIQAQTNTDNIASSRVLEKNGFRMEGVMRKAFFSHGEWRDTVLYSILRSEWQPIS